MRIESVRETRVSVMIVSVVSGLGTRRSGLLGERLLLVIILVLTGEKGIDGGREESSDGK